MSFFVKLRFNESKRSSVPGLVPAGDQNKLVLYLVRFVSFMFMRVCDLSELSRRSVGESLMASR